MYLTCKPSQKKHTVYTVQLKRQSFLQIPTLLKNEKSKKKSKQTPETVITQLIRSNQEVKLIHQVL